MMKRLILAIGAAALLAGCSLGDPPKISYDPVQVDAKLEKVEDRVALVKATASLVRPFVPPVIQEKIDKAIATAEAAIAAARVANDAAARLAAIERARRAAAAIAGDVGIPPDDP